MMRCDKDYCAALRKASRAGTLRRAWTRHRGATLTSRAFIGRFVCVVDLRSVMDLPDSLARAIQRLNGSLDALEAAAERRAEAEAARGDAEAEFAVMQDDRSRLAVELDAALARSRALDRAVEQVSGRLDRADATVRGILAEMADGPGAGPA